MKMLKEIYHLLYSDYRDSMKFSDSNNLGSNDYPLMCILLLTRSILRPSPLTQKKFITKNYLCFGSRKQKKIGMDYTPKSL